MRIWLDDLRDPKDPYIQYRYGAEPDMVWIKDGEELLYRLHLCMLSGLQIDFISFDHDLGTEISGYEIASAIERWAGGNLIKPIAWAVHSDNPVGAARIRTAMQNADRFWAKTV